MVPARRPGWLLEPRRKSGPRGMVAQSRSDARWTEPGLQALWHVFVIASGAKQSRCTSGLLRRSAPRNDALEGQNAQAEEIGRLGFPALAVLRRQEPRGGEASPVRPR